MSAVFERVKIDIEGIASSSKELLTNNRKALAALLPQLDELTAEQQVEALELMNNAVPLEHVIEPFAKRSRHADVAISSATSFCSLLTIASQRRKQHPSKVEKLLNNKAKGYKFVDMLNVDRPHVLQTKVSIAELTLTSGTVVKPHNGSASKGVFLIRSLSDILEVRTGERFANEDALKQHAEKLLADRTVSSDHWSVEELVAGDSSFSDQAHDLKFYSFYGEIGLVLEVERSQGGRYCEWSPQGERIDTGRYKNNGFEGRGFSAEQLAVAKEVSLRIPAPFMRIDFISSANAFKFGEFTPLPGQYHSFNQAYDRRLGAMYLAAEARFMHDLIHGKSFKEFNKLAGIK